MKAVFDALQPPTPASGERAGKARGQTILVVRQTRRNKPVLLFQLRSQHYLILCKVMVFLSISFLLCYDTVRVQIFLLRHKKIMSVSDIAVEAVVVIDLVINIHREFVHLLVNST